MDRKDGNYRRAEQHYKDRTEIYEDRERKILKASKPEKNRQRRFNIFFVLPVIILTIVVFPKIVEFHEKNGNGQQSPPTVREVIDYLELSKSTESSTAEVFKLYSDGEIPDAETVNKQINSVDVVFNALSEQKVPAGFEEYNEYQLSILATDKEILNTMLSERNADTENYFNTMVKQRNSLAGNRKNSMKAALDGISGIKYKENKNGNIDIEYYG
ncbi:MAG: hypothetical protein J1F64_05490 [Oscillospiraceae bacterium]|nr:hypothetical protein [Oscillospiraceae bacterium]